MPKGACKRRTKMKIKEAARMLGASGVRVIGAVVGSLEDHKISNAEKREIAVRVATEITGAREWAARAAVELAVGALKDGRDALAELGDAEESDIESADE